MFGCVIRLFHYVAPKAELRAQLVGCVRCRAFHNTFVFASHPSHRAHGLVASCKVAGRTGSSIQSKSVPELSKAESTHSPE